MRLPAVAGYFYSSDPESLRREIESCFEHRLGPGRPSSLGGERRILGLVSPHAGYMYSGPVAAHGYKRLYEDGKPDLFVILGPNHTGMGMPVATSDEDWKTPLGIAKVDRDVVRELEASGKIFIDENAHAYEHSIEVQIPFLQYLFGEIEFVPISMMMQDLETCLEVGEVLAEVCSDRNVVIIASSDFTHYEPHDVAREKDMMAIDAILEMNPEEMFRRIQEKNITMCGPGPVATMLIACSKLGASEARLLKYATSGDITGDRSRVVGYASIAIYR